MPGAERHPKDKTVEIYIDQQVFYVPKGTISAEDLRAVPEPDIGPDRDLYLEGHGNHDDDLISPGEEVRLKDGLRFFTAPAVITAGHAPGA